MLLRKSNVSPSAPFQFSGLWTKILLRSLRVSTSRSIGFVKGRVAPPNPPGRVWRGPEQRRGAGGGGCGGVTWGEMGCQREAEPGPPAEMRGWSEDQVQLLPSPHALPAAALVALMVAQVSRLQFPVPGLKSPSGVRSEAESEDRTRFRQPGGQLARTKLFLSWTVGPGLLLPPLRHLIQTQELCPRESWQRYKKTAAFH